MCLLLCVGQATEDVQKGVTQEDIDVYYEVWSQFDPKATEYMPLDQLSDFVDRLDEPLRLSAPNCIKLICLNIPIYDGDVVNCVDVLDALTKNALGTAADEVADDLSELLVGRRHRRKLAGTTFKRRRQEYCAKLIQIAWRRHVERGRASRQLTGVCSVVLEEPDDEQ